MSLDINKLLDEVEADVKNLLKSAQTDAANLKKAEEKSKEESSKEESSKEASKKEASALEKSGVAKAEDIKKDDAAPKEDSGYESQAPEASEQQESAPEAAAEAAPEAHQGEEQVEDVAGIMKDLDDDMLHELYQKIKMELMARMQGQEASADQSAAAPEAAAAQQAAPAADMQMAMKSQKEEGEKLSKAQAESKAKDDEIAKLKKSLEETEKGLGEMTDMLQMLIARPVQRAVTDIQFVDKDGGGLKKSESELSDEEIKKAVDSISSDRKKLSTLTKSERDVILDFYAGKNVKEKVIKVINK